jgi:hypothetical protein
MGRPGCSLSAHPLPGAMHRQGIDSPAATRRPSRAATIQHLRLSHGRISRLHVAYWLQCVCVCVCVWVGVGVCM